MNLAASLCSSVMLMNIFGFTKAMLLSACMVTETMKRFLLPLTKLSPSANFPKVSPHMNSTMGLLEMVHQMRITPRMTLVLKAMKKMEMRSARSKEQVTQR